MGEVEVIAHPDTAMQFARRVPGRRDTTAAIYGAFAATQSAPAPAAYLVPASAVEVIDLLDAHGIEWRPAPPRALAGQTLRQFRVQNVETAEQPFQNVRQRSLTGAWESAEAVGDPWVLVPIEQPLGRLAFALLEPEADDGLANWAIVEVQPGEVWPILRVEQQ